MLNQRAYWQQKNIKCRQQGPFFTVHVIYQYLVCTKVCILNFTN